MRRGRDEVFSRAEAVALNAAAVRIETAIVALTAVASGLACNAIARLRRGTRRLVERAGDCLRWSRVLGRAFTVVARAGARHLTAGAT